MTEDGGQKTSRFILAWIGASALGGFVTGALEGGGLHFFATLLLQGLIVGGAQALVLRGRIARWWLWAAITGIVFPLGLMFTGPLSGTTAQRLAATFGLWEVFWLSSMMMAVTLLVTGIGQWAVFQQLDTWWMPLSLLGGVMLGITSATVCLLTCPWLNSLAGEWLASGVTMGAGWLVYALPTGLWLAGRGWDNRSGLLQASFDNDRPAEGATDVDAREAL